MFSLRKLGVYFLLLVSVFVFFKKDEFTFFQEKVNKQETILLKASEGKLDRRVGREKGNRISSLDTITLEENYLPRYNENTQIQDIDVIPEELIILEALATGKNRLDKVEPNASDVTPQELLDMEYSAREEKKEGSLLAEIESSRVTPQELLDMEYSVTQEKEMSNSIGIENSSVTPQELLDIEVFFKKQNKLGVGSSEAVKVF